jgi:hypothetical protein
VLLLGKSSDSTVPSLFPIRVMLVQLARQDQLELLVPLVLQVPLVQQALLVQLAQTLYGILLALTVSEHHMQLVM